MKDFSKFYNKQIAILGYGREGRSTLRFLLAIGVQPSMITILDGAEQIEGLTEHLLDINANFGPENQVNIVIGSAYLDSLKKFDIIIKTPGISLYNDKILPFKKKITSQMQMFFEYYQGKTIAISGTKGKSTTSTLVYETLQRAGKKTILIGNIGNPALDYLDIQNLSSQKDEYAVCEISSYMLEGIQKENYISILLNIYPEHLDWHQGFENYQKAKLSILYGSKYNLLRHEIIRMNEWEEEDFKEFNVRMFGQQGKYSYHENKFYIGKKMVFDDEGILLRGEHNMMNICAIVGVCDIMHIDTKVLKETLMSFAGIPHRMEIVGEYGGITRIDDAISTIPESTIQAIKTFGKQIDTIFLGGTDRGYNFKDLAKTIKEYKIRNVVIFPDSGAKIYKEIKKYDLGEIKFLQTSDMREAVAFAYEHTKDRGICLLSTASPSYSVRKNFEEKGNLFQKYIKELAK